MAVSSIFLLVLLLLSFSVQSSSSSSSSPSSLNNGFSLSVEQPVDVILSPNGLFSTGFYAVGDNAYILAFWFTESQTVVWSASRDQPVNGKRSSLSLLKTGNLVLSDAGQFTVWSTHTTSSLPTQLILNNNGNLVLSELHQLNGSNHIILWQSFDFPTDTLLPGQQLTRYTKLVSSRSNTNYSSGFYKPFFDNNNILSLLYDGPDVSSKYWPAQWLLSWEVGRTTYNNSRIAVLDSLGGFISTDNYKFTTSDYGVVKQRRLKLDPDGNIRIYSRQNNLWEMTWQAMSDPCRAHGLCGANSTCKYDPREGRKCWCLPGYRVKNHSDWSYGCEPKFQLSCFANDSTFLKLADVELYGSDYIYIENIGYRECEDKCLKDCECKAFQHSFHQDSGYFQCYTKRLLLNGRHSPYFRGITYLRLPKIQSNNSSFLEEEEFADENGSVCLVKLERAYAKRHMNRFVKFSLWFSVAIGVFEVLFISITWFSLIRTKQNSGGSQQGYSFLSPFGFKRYNYSELKQATKGFIEEIGRGAGGIVYRGELPGEGIAAIKKLNNNNVGAKQEGEFLAEMSTISRLNHMNLIKMWGYCAEGKHRLLVYELMEKGSLAENLKSNTLDWTKRYNIALGTARALAYLHEECLEWILHCDIKPQNILLDSNYQPKVADFGLSKLQNRNDRNTQSFSTIRGTRGYMAPEWVFNQPITSKVDVYSYGIVVLEMITGRSPTTMGIHGDDDGEEPQNNVRLVTWVREKKKKNRTTPEEVLSSGCWVEQIIDAAIEFESEYGAEKRKMETLVKVALKCVEQVKDARPTMSQVVEMLQSHEDGDVS